MSNVVKDLKVGTILTIDNVQYTLIERLDRCFAGNDIFIDMKFRQLTKIEEKTDE